MVLKNKDGSLYKCNSPNPLAKGQIWLEKYELHNCDFPVTFEEEPKELQPVVKEEEPQPVPIPEIVLVPEPPKEEVVIEVPEPPKEEVVEIVERSEEKVPKYKNAVVFHCLPFVDNIYGNPYDFEALIVENQDLYFKFWASIIISNGSIVYPYKYSVKKTQYPGYRWWKVVNSTPHKGGFLINSITSEECPDFT